MTGCSATKVKLKFVIKITQGNGIRAENTLKTKERVDVELRMRVSFVVSKLANWHPVPFVIVYVTINHCHISVVNSQTRGE